jgi:hypothetical protein
MELWWYVLIAVLALAVAESLLGNRHLKEGGIEPARDFSPAEAEKEAV